MHEVSYFSFVLPNNIDPLQCIWWEKKQGQYISSLHPESGVPHIHIHVCIEMQIQM